MYNIEKNKTNNGEVKNMKKKKGFTLIELIAVIAILGILAVVLVPNILGYTTKAKVSKVQSDAGILVRAIDTYEAETAQADLATVLVSGNASAGAKYENTVTLASLFKEDTDQTITATHTSPNLIFGDMQPATGTIEAPVKTLPGEFFLTGKNAAANNIAEIKISDLRKIATREVTVTVNNGDGGRVDKVNGTAVTFTLAR